MRKINVNMPLGLAMADSPHYDIPDHWALINEHLLDIAEGKLKRLIISMPPRHGKSELTTKYFPAWYMLNNPTKNVIVTGHSASFTEDKFGEPIRKLVSFYGNSFDVSIDQRSNSKKRFQTNHGGMFNALGVGGSIMGRGAHLFVIDDPINDAEQAYSPRQREKIWDWFLTTPMTRLEPGAAVVIIMTRWHKDDLIGRILTSELAQDWTYLCLPAINEAGKALWSNRYPVDELQKLRTALGTYKFNSLFQQNPISDENIIYNPEWWKLYDELPKLEYKAQAWDTAFKDGEQNDYSACVTGGTNDGEISYITDVWRSRLQSPQLLAKIKDMAEIHKPDLILIEDAASGQSLIQFLRNETRLPISAVPVSGDKVLRANIVSPKIESGCVYIPEYAKWKNDFIIETAEFPFSAHDDIVDALNMLVRHLSTFTKSVVANNTPLNDKFKNYFKR